MPAYLITYSHSHMPPGYIGRAYKHANTPKDAAECIGKYSVKEKVIVDKRRNVLSNVEITQL